MTERHVAEAEATTGDKIAPLLDDKEGGWFEAVTHARDETHDQGRGGRPCQ